MKGMYRKKWIDMNTLVAVLSNIEKTQNEIIACMITQICENMENVSVVDFYKDYKLSKTTYGEYDIIKADQWEYNGWLDIYKHYRDMVEYVDNVILIKTPTLRGQYTSMLDTKLLKKLDKGFTKDNQYQMSQDLMKRLIERLVFVKAIRDKNVFQFCIDTQEVDFSEVWKFKSYKRLYPFNGPGMTYFPMYEWAMANTFIQEIDKAQDLYFIASAFTDERREYMEYFKKEVYRLFGKKKVGPIMANPKTGLFDYYDDEDRREVKVSQSKYLYNLKLSRYTIVTQPYDTDRFNMLRFMEALICDCTPIIMPANNFEDLRLTFPDIYDIIDIRDLKLTKRVTNNYPIEHFINARMGITQWETDRDTLKLLKESKSYQRITNQKYVQNELRRLLEG